jgi:hypothetical protein
MQYSKLDPGIHQNSQKGTENNPAHKKKIGKKKEREMAALF